jgi:hypothetical protein
MPPLSAGQSRIRSALRPWRHQLRPGAVEVLAAVAMADLHDVRDPGQLEDLVGRRLALAESRRWLVGPFDPRDRVGAPPRDVAPVDRPPSGPPALRPLTRPPAGVEASP